LLSDYSSYSDVIATLRDDLHYNIALHLPYQLTLNLLKLAPFTANHVNNNGKKFEVEVEYYESSTRQSAHYRSLISRDKNLSDYYDDSNEVEFYTNKGYCRHVIQQLWYQLHDVLLFTGNYSEGYKDGRFLYWNKQGELIREENYKRGLLHGLSIKHVQTTDMTTKSYYNNGNLVSETNYYDYQSKRYL